SDPCDEAVAGRDRLREWRRIREGREFADKDKISANQAPEPSQPETVQLAPPTKEIGTDLDQQSTTDN
ncbi:MAG: hypothetical protein AAGC88_01025, partial [Bacteroidota bacterium]